MLPRRNVLNIMPKLKPRTAYVGVRYEPQHFQALATHQQHTATQSGLVLLVMFAWSHVCLGFVPHPSLQRIPIFSYSVE
jgi:hypothetical protein